MLKPRQKIFTPCFQGPVPDAGEPVLDAVGPQLCAGAAGVLQQVQHRREPAGQLRQDQLLLQVRHGVQEVQDIVSYFFYITSVSIY